MSLVYSIISATLAKIFQTFGFASPTTAVRASMMQHQRTEGDSEAPGDVAIYI